MTAHENALNARRMLIDNLDLAIKRTVDAVSDVEDAELLGRSDCLSTPASILERAAKAIHSVIPVVDRSSDAEPLDETAFLGPSVRFASATRELLGRLVEVPAAAYSLALSQTVDLGFPSPRPQNLSEIVVGLTMCLYLLIGEISVTRAALGKPEPEWQRSLDEAF